MARHPLWEQRLGAFLEANASRRHEYGRFDCVLMPADAVKAVTGKDHGKGHRRKYATALTAARYLKGLGFDSPEALIDSILPEKPVGFAQRGDLVLCRTDSGDNPGLCMGAYALVVADEGMIRCPRDRWLRAWRVG